MMHKTVEYYFSPISGYAYLGHKAFLDIAQESKAEVHFLPIDIGKVFAASGTTPPANQSKTRKRYRQEDMARYANHHNLPLNITPKFWPTQSILACKAIIAAKKLGLNQGHVSGAILEGVWVHDEDIADPHTLTKLFNQASLPGQDILQECSDPALSQQLDDITDAAIENGVFGSPSYVVDKQLFWGQDRLAMLRQRLI